MKRKIKKILAITFFCTLGIIVIVLALNGFPELMIAIGISAGIIGVICGAVLAIEALLEGSENF